MVKKLLVSNKKFTIDAAIESMLNLMLKMLGNLVVLNIIDKRIPFHHNNLDLPPKPKFNFRNLKRWVQEFHSKFVLASTDKVDINFEVV